MGWAHQESEGGRELNPGHSRLRGQVGKGDTHEESEQSAFFWGPSEEKLWGGVDGSRIQYCSFNDVWKELVTRTGTLCAD